MAYGDFKDLAKGKAADNVFKNKPFNIAKDSKCDGYQRGLASKFFDKKIAGSRLSYTIKSAPQNKQLAEELHKPIKHNYWTITEHLYCVQIVFKNYKL